MNERQMNREVREATIDIREDALGIRKRLDSRGWGMSPYFRRKVVDELNEIRRQIAHLQTNVFTYRRKGREVL